MKKRKSKTSIFTIIILIFILFFLLKSANSFYRQYDLVKQQTDRQNKDINYQTEKEVVLKKKKKFLQSTKGLEKELFDKYMIKIDGERVIVLE